ncbi:MAG: SPOR domain-containing protein [Caulobacterales bacterium]|nr:SPOR domain-containing protein [Caulobacterales bacterium]
MVSIRTIVATPLLVALGGCSLVEADPQRFERWAESVAAIPMTDEPVGLRPAAFPAQVMGLRPAVDLGSRTPMRIEVVEAEELWEHRANGFQAAGEALPHPVAEVVVERAVARAPVVAQQVVRTLTHTVQLGAFSSRAAAEAAWSRVAGHTAFSGTTPRYEEIQRDGRTLVRLRTDVAASHVRAACQAAQAGDFCESTGVS